MEPLGVGVRRVRFRAHRLDWGEAVTSQPRRLLVGGFLMAAGLALLVVAELARGCAS